MSNRIVIIGGGPAGYEAALAGAKYGADVTIIEERGIGGSSVLLGCVPSKSFFAGTGSKTDLRRADDMGLNSLLGRARIHLPALNKRVQVLAQEQSDDIHVQLERAGVRMVHGRGRFAESQLEQLHHRVTATLEDGTEEIFESELVLLASGGTDRRGIPFGTPDDPASVADPLPQAFVLTAIVIAMATTTILLTLAALGRDDDTDVPEPADDNIAADPVATLGRAAGNGGK